MDLGFAVRYYSNRVFWRVARPLRTAYRFFARPNARAVKVLIRDRDRILLALVTYGHRLWTLPGGAVDGDESFEEAGRREVLEEVGLRLSELREIGEYSRFHDYQRVTIKAFEAVPESTDAEPDGIEIREAKWFAIDSLPENRAANVDAILAMVHQFRGR